MQQDETIRLEIENLLRKKIGLNPESVGSRSILRAVKKGMRSGKMQALSDYLDDLQSSPEQFESLVESVVVPETSFFRNRASFVFLRQWVAQDWSHERPLRVLSLPCSTGEEPYSIAITLLEEGLTLDQFEVDGVDISALALTKAKQGIYSPYAFRRQTYRSDDKYFKLGVPDGVSQGKRVTQRYYLSDVIRDKVSFYQGNVLDPSLLADKPPYDIIFCRNLLIYFDREARDRTFEKINQLLVPNGLLFLGYAETSIVNGDDYQPVPYPQTFAYRKQSKSDSGTPAQTVASSIAGANAIGNRAFKEASLNNHTANNLEKETAEKKSGETKRSQHLRNATSAAVRATADSQKTEASSLSLAQQLANEGAVSEAVVQCDRYLANHSSDAAAHLLRGELHQTMGEDDAAIACFEKSIYLDPRQVDALTHLMLLKEQKQDFTGAVVIRDRLQRLIE